MKPEAQIAVAYGSPGGAVADISIAIKELTAYMPQPVRLDDLAGPNETVQILLNHEGWVLVAKAVAVIYGAEIIKEAAKSSWKMTAPKLESASNELHAGFLRLVSGIRQAIHAKAPVVLGFPRTPVAARRNIGIEIAEGSPGEIARIIILFAENGHEIEQRLDEWDRLHSSYRFINYEENSDCSVKVTLSQDGAFHLNATFSDTLAKDFVRVQFNLRRSL